MSFYTIKDLERLSSQKAHTIRIWEQRYGLLKPERTETNIRYYNDDELKKLLNVCTLIDRGMKISHISKLSKQEMAIEVGKIITGLFDEDTQIEGIISNTLLAIATYDEALFHKMFRQSVDTLGLQETYIKIIYPLLVRTGLMWANDSLLPAQEHFLSNLVRQKLFTAIDGLSLPEKPDQTWVLFLNEQEDHEIGLLFANYLLRSHGKKVIYLGARVPYQDLVSVVKQNNPTHIYTFFVKNEHEKELENLVDNLIADFEDCSLCFSGSGEKLTKVAGGKDVNQITTIQGLINVITAHA